MEDFLAGYHAAYALIYDQGDYVAGIAALRALGFDDNADVANLIGYASRKLGRYEDAKFWYERALAAQSFSRTSCLRVRSRLRISWVCAYPARTVATV